MHFLRAARTLLNSAPLTVATRGGVNRVLTAAGLPALRPRPWERDGGGHETSSAEGEEDSYWETDEDEEGDGGEGPEQHGSRGERPRQRRCTDGAGGAGAPQRLGSSQQLQSFPVSAENSEDEGERAQQAQREAPSRGRAAPAAAGGRDAPAAVAAGGFSMGYRRGRAMLYASACMRGQAQVAMLAWQQTCRALPARSLPGLERTLQRHTLLSSAALAGPERSWVPQQHP